jgi:hypothetical protein
MFTSLVTSIIETVAGAMCRAPDGKPDAGDRWRELTFALKRATEIHLLVDETNRFVWLVYSRPVRIARFSPSLRSGTIK